MTRVRSRAKTRSAKQKKPENKIITGLREAVLTVRVGDLGPMHSRGYADFGRGARLDVVPSGLTPLEIQFWRYGWLEAFNVVNEAPTEKAKKAGHELWALREEFHRLALNTPHQSLRSRYESWGSRIAFALIDMKVASAPTVADSQPDSAERAPASEPAPSLLSKFLRRLAGRT